jgi:PAS domain S-box-containing protein
MFKANLKISFVILFVILLASNFFYFGKAEKYVSRKISQNDTIDVLFGYHAPPYAFYNHEGEYVGMLIDYYNELKKNSKINFRIKNFDTWDNLIKYAKVSDNYIIIGANRSSERENYLSFTNTFIKAPHVVVTRRNSKISDLKDIYGKKVLTVKNYTVNEFIEENYPNIKATKVDNDLIGLQKLSLGEYDAMILNQIYVSYFVESESLSNLKIAYQFDYYDRLAIAVSKVDWDLYEEIDKVLSKIKPERHREIFNKWVTVSSPLINKTIRNIILGIIILLVLSLLLTWGWLTSLRKQVEQQTQTIKESESKYRLLVENSQDAIYIRYQQRFLLINDKFAALFGYTKDEILSKDFDILRLIDEESKDFVKKVIQESPKPVINEGIHELKGITKEGRKLHLNITVTYIAYKDSYISQAIIHDITSLRENEKELLEAKNKAEEADRLKTAFLANMSHEIRTPMNGIIGFSELLKNPGLEDEDRDRYIEIINQSGMRMLDTLNDIINISKIHSGQVSINNTEFDIVELINNLYDFFKPEAVKKNLGLNYKQIQAFDSKIIISDKLKIESIVTNLVKNAIKYTNEGHVDIILNIQDNMLEIVVEDTGIGIAEDKTSKIFERFIQENENNKLVTEGFGLGLAISKSYSNLMKGNLSVKSQKNVGSEFSLKIPLFNQ